MPIQITCDICLTVYNLPDNKAGKRVTCRKCENTILVPGEAQVEILDAIAITDDELPSPSRSPRNSGSTRIQKASPRSAADEEEIPTWRKGKSRSRNEDEEEARPKKGSALPLILAGVVTFLFLGCSGVMGAAYWILSSASTAAEERAQQFAREIEEAQKREEARRPPPFPEPGPVVNPIPNPNPNPFPVGQKETPQGPTPSGQLTPPQNVDEALARLGDSDPFRRKSGLDWLQQAPVDESRKAKVAQALEPLLDKIGTRDVALQLLRKWATPDTVPALLRLLEDPSPHVCRPVFEILARLQDDRSIEPMAKCLADPHKGSAAENALRGLGKKAEKAVLGYLHHRDSFARRRSRSLLTSYGTSEEVILDQTVRDLESTELETCKEALNSLNARRKVNPEKQAKVSKVLEGLLQNADPAVKYSALRALQVWGTKESTPALLGLLEDPMLKSQVIPILGKLQDERACKPLVALALASPVDRGAVIRALQDIGPSAERAAHEFLKSPDVNVRREGIRLLGDIGTNASIPILQTLSKQLLLSRSPVDKLQARDCITAMNKIKTRK